MKKFLENEYVIWCEFDMQFQNELQSCCDNLEKNEIPMGIRPPHLTLTFVTTDYIDQLIELTREFFKQSSTIMIHSVGAFPNGILYYAPKAGGELLGMQEEYVGTISKIADVSWDLYESRNWIPHIALTAPLDNSTAATAFSIMMSNFSLSSAKIKMIVIKKCIDGEIVLRHEI